MKYNEICILHKMLSEADIPHTFKPCSDGFQICYPVERSDPACVMDAIECHYSYGHENDLIEIMGLVNPKESFDYPIRGGLTAKEVLSRIKRHFKNK